MTSASRIALRVQENLWPLNVAAAVLGLVTCLLVLSIQSQTIGQAWIIGASDARAAIGGIFGAQATIFSIGLSLTMLALQNAAGTYTPRLLDLYVRLPQVRWVIPFFVFSGTFNLIAVWRLGFDRTPAPEPRPVVGAAFVLLFVGAVLLPYQILATIRAIRIEDILLALVRTARRAAEQLAEKRARLRVAGELPPPPSDAVPVLATRAGFLADIDVERALRIASARGLRIWIEPRLGAWLDVGDRIGWVHGERQLEASGLAGCALTWRVRTFRYDVAFPIRLLADIGIKALSPAVNDPTTARMALRQLRQVLEALAGLGPSWTVSDAAGVPRLSLEVVDEAECLSVAMEGMTRYGSGDPELLAEVVAVLRSLGTRRPSLRESVLLALRRVRKDAEAGLDPGRAQRLSEAISRAEDAIRSGEVAGRHEPAGGFLFT